MREKGKTRLFFMRFDATPYKNMLFLSCKKLVAKNSEKRKIFLQGEKSSQFGSRTLKFTTLDRLGDDYYD